MLARAVQRGGIQGVGGRTQARRTPRYFECVTLPCDAVVRREDATKGQALPGLGGRR